MSDKCAQEKKRRETFICEDAPGQWKANKMNGKGTYYFTNGDKYSGDWVDGKRNGEGVFTLVDGDRYDTVYSIMISLNPIRRMCLYEAERT